MSCLSRLSLLLCTLVLTLSLGACSQSAHVYTQQVLSLGTIVDVSIYGVPDAKAEKAVEAVREQMQIITHRWHAWRPGRLTEINTLLEEGKSVKLTPHESHIFQRAMTLAKQTNYLFDPAIGKLVALWGFHTDVRPKLPPPSKAAIAAILRYHPSMADLHLKNNILSCHNPAVQMDFGGYAKGIAIDLGIATLKKLGIHNAIVNAGGDLRVIGSKGGKPWLIGIRHPRVHGVIAAVKMQGDESIYTSGDYERFFIYHGKRYNHIINPRTGMPAQGVSSVTVINDNAAMAEAADKALFISGPKGFAKMAAKLGVTQAMLIDTKGTVYMTPAMAKRIQFVVVPTPKTVIVKLPHHT